jgi:hypothetical protein
LQAAQASTPDAIPSQSLPSRQSRWSSFAPPEWSTFTPPLTVRTGNSDQIDVSFGDGSARQLANSEETRLLKSRPGGQVPADTERDNDGTTTTISAITITGGGFYAERQGAYLVVVLPLTNPRPSSTGKTNILGTTGGPRAISEDFDGRPILVNATAMVNPNQPAWRLRAYALLAQWEGKQASRANRRPSLAPEGCKAPRGNASSGFCWD